MTYHIPISPPRTFHIPLPRPSEASSINTNTDSLKPATKNHLTSIQKEATPHTSPQLTQKSPLLPMPPTPLRQHIRNIFIPRPPPYSNHHFYQKQHFSRPYNATRNQQQPPLLPRPIPSYILVIILTPSDQINNILAPQTKLLYQNHY